MSLIASATKTDYKLVPAGNHVARCYRIIDLGSQSNKFGNLLRKVNVTWELFGEDDEGNPLTVEDGRPLVISFEYTLSLSEKAHMRLHLESWRNKQFTVDELAGFDIQNILGQFCMLSIVHNTANNKSYANIKSVSPVPAIIRKAGLPEGVNDIFYFSLNDEFDKDKFDKIPDFLKKKIVESPEYKKVSNLASDGFPKTLSSSKDDMDDEIPF